MTSDVLSLFVAHLRLVLIAIGVGSVFGLTIGIVAARNRFVERSALGAASLIQAVPALALLAAMVPLFAWLGHVSGLPISGIGEVPALVALTLYAILPIARGVVVGIRSIDPAVDQAALAVGMTDRQRFRLVDLPLAMPATLAGLRTATAWTVGMATLATPIGARSLGNLIFSGLQTRHYDQVALGCAAAAAMAISLDALLTWAERRARGRRPGRVAAVVFGAIGMATVGAVIVGLAPSSAARPIRIGAKSFTEQLILAEVLRCAVGNNSPVEVRPSLGTTVAFDAVRSGDLDAYVEYTGTAWSTILKRTTQVDRETMRSEVAAALQRDFGVRVVADLGFENAYALVVRADNPAQRISDLGAAATSLFGGDYEFFERSEWQALRASYGLAPRETRAMDPSLLYDALSTGGVDVIAGYTTDGRIDAMHLHVLSDDRGAIPPYDAIVVVSERLARDQPEIAARFAALEHSIDPERMRRWNAAVDSGGATPAAVVRDHPACR